MIATTQHQQPAHPGSGHSAPVVPVSAQAAPPSSASGTTTSVPTSSSTMRLSTNNVAPTTAQYDFKHTAHSLSAGMFAEQETRQFRQKLLEQQKQEQQQSKASAGKKRPAPTSSSSPAATAAAAAKKKHSSAPQEAFPVLYLRTLFGKTPTGQAYLHQIFQKVQPSPECLEAYNLAAVQAVRAGNVEELRKLWKQQGPHSMNACNRFGESLVHMACRRGNIPVLKFLLQEAQVPLDHVVDDFGRLPLHDACWTGTPQLELVDLLLEHVRIETLMQPDVRGFTPFQYARRDHWDTWVEYLKTKTPLILLKLQALPLPEPQQPPDAAPDTTSTQAPLAQPTKPQAETSTVPTNANASVSIVG